jgi:hypothetical protein
MRSVAINQQGNALLSHGKGNMTHELDTITSS